MNNTDTRQQEQKRHILNSIIKCLLFLSQQNVAFRGRDDDGIPDRSNVSEGNFKLLVLFRVEAGDRALQTNLKHHQKDATYRLVEKF